MATTNTNFKVKNGLDAGGNISTTAGIAIGSSTLLANTQAYLLSTSTTNVGLVLRGASGQTADLLQLQSATPSTLAVFDSSGRLNSTTAGNFGGLPAGLGFLGVQTSANTWGLVVRGGALQVNHLAVFQNSGGTTLGGINANSQIFTGSAQPLTTSTGGATTATSGTGTVATITTTSNHNLASGDRVTIAGITPAGYNGTYIVTGTPTTTSFTYNNATTGAQTVAGTVVVDSQVSTTARSAATVGLLIRSAASQVANPFEVQNSSGTVIANVSSSGGVRATGTLQGATLSAVSDGSTVATLSSSGNIQFRGAASYGGGVGVIGIANATTAPSTSPTGGGILFVNSGALQYRGTSGANATLVNADGTTPYLGLGASYFAGHNPEGRLMYNTYLTNDMANARLRGSAVSATQNGSPYSISNANWDAMFDGTASFFNISPTSGFTFPLVITVPLPRTLTYGAYVGLSFGSTTFRANSVTIEVFSLDSSSWVTIFTTTTNTSEDIFAAVSGLVNGNATGINQVRYTISSPNSTQLRLQHLWAYNFNSDMWSQTMMPRGGGSFYAPISVTTVSDAVVMSVRGAASGGASIQTQDLQRWQTWNGTTATTVAYVRNDGLVNSSAGFTGPWAWINGYRANTTLAVTSNGNSAPTMVIRGANAQTQDMQQWITWDGTTETVRARVDSGGNFKANNVATLNSIGQLAEANSGALLVMGRATAQTSSPGLNTGTLYFRDGTTSGTLRLATRTGASGIEETIVDNLSSTGSTAGAQFVGAGGVNTAGTLTSTGLLLSGTTSPITLNGSVGTSGQVLTSGGAGATPTWTTVSGGTFTGGTLTGNLTLAAGTTSLSPLTFQSGSNLTTVTAGANEYDGTVFYQTSNTNPGRALNTQNYYYASSSDYGPDFTASGAVKSMLGGATTGITVAAGTTYEYEFYTTVQHQYITNAGVTGTYAITSSTVSGSPTVAVTHQVDYGSNTTNFTTATTLSTVRTTGSVTFSAAISSGSRYNFLRAKGIVRVTGTGTAKIYPGLSTSQVGASDNIWTVQAGTVFKLTPIGNGTVTTVGTWA